MLRTYPQAVWIPGRLVNPLNASGWHWRRRSRWAKDWRKRTTLAVLKAEDGHPRRPANGFYFMARVWSRFDGDGLAAACKPVRDQLAELFASGDDSEASGTRWEYDQVVDRKVRGVTVTLLWREPRALREPAPQLDRLSALARYRTHPTAGEHRLVDICPLH